MTQRRTRLEVSLKFHRQVTKEGRVPKQRVVEATKVIDRGAPRRTVRVEDDLWSQASGVAGGLTSPQEVTVDLSDCDGLSAVIRRFLVAYVMTARSDGSTT